MRKWRFIVPYVVIFAGFVASGWGQETKPKPEPPKRPNVADIAAVVDVHNRERAKNNLPPLKLDPKLEAAALVHARDMAEHDKMSHEGSDGSTPAQRIERQDFHYRAAGENVAAGQPSVKEVMQGWLESPPHKKNILGDFTEIGVACVKAEDGKPYWCVTFGKSWPVFEPSVAEASILEGLNQARSKAEKPALRIERKLQEVAERHARDTAARGSYRATDNEGKTPFQRLDKAGYRYRRVGQLVAVGQATPEEAVESWLKDSANRESILGDFTEVGVGYATSEKGIPFWVILIAKPQT